MPSYSLGFLPRRLGLPSTALAAVIRANAELIGPFRCRGSPPVIGICFDSGCE